jgi:hypothetical protein
MSISAGSPTYQHEINGINEAMIFYRNAFTHRRFGMHNGHTPEIKVNGDAATGIWYLNDLFINLDEQTILTGSALYETAIPGSRSVAAAHGPSGCWR